MKRNWNTTRLIAAGGLGVLAVALQLVGSSINAITGTAGASIINTLIGSAIVVVCLFVIDLFGSVTLMYAVFGILALPFFISGVPGFLPKIPIMIFGGFLVDLVFFLIKVKNALTSFIVGGVRTVYVGVSVIEVGRIFGIPGIEESASFLYTPIGFASALILGGVGGLLGFFIYSRIKNSKVILQIRGN